MNRSKILNELLDILRDLAPMNEVSEDQASKTLESLGFDSLDESGFLLNIEEKYDIKISDEEASGLQTINQYVDYLVKRLV